MEQNGTAPKVRCPRNQSHLSVYSLSLLVDNQDWMATGPFEEKPIVQGSEAANHGRFPNTRLLRVYLLRSDHGVLDCLSATLTTCVNQMDVF